MKFKSLRSFDLIISNITNNIRKSAEHIPTEPKKAEEWISNVIKGVEESEKDRKKLTDSLMVLAEKRINKDFVFPIPFYSLLN